MLQNQNIRYDGYDAHGAANCTIPVNMQSDGMMKKTTMTMNDEEEDDRRKGGNRLREQFLYESLVSQPISY